MSNNRDERPARSATSEGGSIDQTGGRATGSVRPKTFSPQGPLSPPAPAWDQFEHIRARETHGLVGQESLYQMARATMKSRRLRNRYLPGPMFGEPAWDMLLALYIVDRRGARETISSLCLSSGSPTSTALRWLDYLEQQKFVSRRQSSTDRRVVFIDLTDAGRGAVESYLAELCTSIFPKVGVE